MERNLPFVDHPTYLAHGYPIASGVMEGACRHCVKDRCELSGMRRSQSGGAGPLRLRAIADNNGWEEYHTYCKQPRHLRLHGLLPLNLQPAEMQSFVSQPLPPKHVEQPTSSEHAAAYSSLSLAV